MTDSKNPFDLPDRFPYKPIPLIAVGRPTCAKCNKLVDWMQRYYDTDARMVHFQVGCHSELEEIVISLEDLQHAKDIKYGVAFKQSGEKGQFIDIYV